MNSELKELIVLEIRLISRNKRPRFLLSMTLIILLYAFAVVTAKTVVTDSVYIFLPFIFMCSGYLFVTQLTLAWESSYYSFLMLTPLRIKYFFMAKHLIFCVYSTIMAIVGLSFLFIDPKFVTYVISAFLYSIGIGSVIGLYFSVFNTRPIDLIRGSYVAEGFNISQYLMSIIALGIPIVTLTLCAEYYTFNSGLYIIALLGVLGIILTGFSIKVISSKLHRRREILFQAFNSN